VSGGKTGAKRAEKECRQQMSNFGFITVFYEDIMKMKFSDKKRPSQKLGLQLLGGLVIALNFLVICACLFF